MRLRESNRGDAWNIMVRKTETRHRREIEPLADFDEQRQGRGDTLYVFAQIRG